MLVTKDTGDGITGTQWMKKFIQQVESPEKEEAGAATNLAGAGGDSARKKKKFVK